MKFWKKRKSRLAKEVKSLKNLISITPAEIRKNNHEAIIDEELRDLNEKKTIQRVINLSFLLAGIFLLSSYIFLSKTTLAPLFNFFIGVCVLMLISFIVSRKSVPIKTIKNYERLLFTLKQNKSLFNDNAYTPEKIFNQIDHLVLRIDKGYQIENSEISLFDTRTITLLIEILNTIKDTPKFNQIKHAKIVSKITGCSQQQFKKYVHKPLKGEKTEKRSQELIKRLNLIKAELNNVEFTKANHEINRKIKKLEEISKKFKNNHKNTTTTQ